MAYVQTTVTIPLMDAGKTLATAVFAALEDMGWTLYDDISTWRKVYRSDGEAETGLYVYLLFDGNYNNEYGYIRYYVYGAWNTSTHTGSFCNSTNSVVPRLAVYSAEGDWVICGNKDFMLFCYPPAHTPVFIGGAIPTLYYNPTAFLTSGVTSGTAKVLSVDTTTTDFGIGKKYYIYDKTTGYIQQVTISAKTSSTLTVASLSQNYTSGSVVAISPFRFGFGNSTTTYNRIFFCIVENTPSSQNQFTFAAETKTALATDTPYQAQVLCNVSANLKTLSTVYGTTPVLAGNFATEGETFPTIVYTGGYAAALEGSIFAVTLEIPETGLVTSSSSTNVIDTSKSWTTNQFAGNVVAITVGTGEGQIREIVSNTATSLTLIDDFAISLVASGSTYEICKAIYIPCIDFIAVKIQSYNVT